MTTTRGLFQNACWLVLLVVSRCCWALLPHPVPAITVTPDQVALGASITAFASSHIGLSAVRNTLIPKAGALADSFGLVGNSDWKLPKVWPGDAVSGNQILPDVDTAGRQIYRLGYTLLSFVTLGSALGSYLDCKANCIVPAATATTTVETSSFFCMAAVLANTAALASLGNASPLGLMPGFTTTAANNHETNTTTLFLPIQRQDALKFTPRGLTRITRHPLILPVVPWGVANACLLGGSLADWLLFGGLAIYAVLGCAAQDLRVQRQEGSVGTVFLDNNNDNLDDGTALQDFFASTSFVPFGAVLHGRQMWKDIVTEFPIWNFVLAAPIGWQLEQWMVLWIQQQQQQQSSLLL